MALVLNGTTQYLISSNPAATGTVITLVGWIKTSNLANFQAYFVLNNSASATNRNVFYAGNSGSALLQAATGSSSALAAATTSALPSGAWFQYICQFTAANARSARFNNGTAATNATSLTPTGINRSVIGARVASTTDGFLNGKAAALGVYNKALSAGEMTALQTMAPWLVSPDDLIAAWDLRTGPNAIHGGASYNMTEVNSPTYDGDLPPINFGAAFNYWWALAS